MKVCLQCKYIVNADVERCPVCGGEEFSELYSGEIVIINPEKSEVAKLINAKMPGVYAISIK